MVMGDEGTDRVNDDSHFWLEQRGRWWSSSLREVAYEEQGLGEHDTLIFEHVDFVVLIGPIQMVVKYKELELRREIWAEDKDLGIVSEGMAMGGHEPSGVRTRRELRTKSWGTWTLTAGQRRALKWQPHLLCDVR